jgi:hypothetical protein
MPKLTPEERAELEARLAQDDDDDDDEVEIGYPDGSYTRGKYRRVAGIARARGYKIDPDPEPGEAEKVTPIKKQPPAHFRGRQSS